MALGAALLVDEQLVNLLSLVHLPCFQEAGLLRRLDAAQLPSNFQSTRTCPITQDEGLVFKAVQQDVIQGQGGIGAVQLLVEALILVGRVQELLAAAAPHERH